MKNFFPVENVSVPRIKTLCPILPLPPCSLSSCWLSCSFHTGQIAGTNWQEVSLSQIIQYVNIPYLLFSMGVAGLVCLTAVLLFWRYRRDEVKQLIHRQKLARMVLENKRMNQSREKKTLFSKTCLPAVPKKPLLTFPKIYTG